MAEVTPDHYATLGVPATAKTAEIRAAYLALMREYHPDRNPDPAAVERAQAVIAAFKVLGDFDGRNHYDWDRRREREAAEAEAAAEAAKRPRRIRAGAITVGAIALVAAATWALMPAPRPKSVMTELKVTEARKPPVARARPNPGGEAKRVAVAAPAEPKAKAEKNQPVRKVEPRAPPVRMAKAEPVIVAAKPKVERAPAMRVAAVKAPVPRTVPPPTLPPPRVRAAAQSVRPAAKPASDLASLDQFVMGFYGQSWRHGDAPKRAALEQSRASFVARRGGCAGDSCKRDAYLKLMRDVSAIVESGQPIAP